MKILCTTSSFSAIIFPDDYEVIYNPYKRKLSEEELIELIKKHNPDGMIAGVEPITRKVLSEAGNLRVISRCGVGLDSVDLEAACDFNILVYNTPMVPVKPVAELTVGMIFSLVRNIPRMDENLKQGNWMKHNGGLVSEKVIGIVGCGRIGSHVARLLEPTGAKILGFDPALTVHKHCEMVSLHELIHQSDVISLHIPLTNENKNLINEKTLRSAKKGAIIINTSRGGLIDEGALYKYLMSGHLSGAGLDVFEDEPYRGPLCSLKNVILTPHIGSTAGNSRYEMEAESVRNLIEGLGKIVSA